MKTLLIYVPTCNRLGKLKECVKRLVCEIRGFESEVVVHISDNCSTDGTYDYLLGLKHTSIFYSRNAENIGLPQNVLKSHDFAT